MQLNFSFRSLAFALFGFTAAGAFTFTAAGAHATLHNIDEVLGGSSGFGASLFHSGAGMSGSNLAGITGVNAAGVNTYDDTTGVLDVLLDLGGSFGTVRLTSNNVEFGVPAGNGIRTLVDSVADGTPIAATIDADFMGMMPAGLTDTLLNFTEGFQCCGSTDNDPNSFGPDINAPGSNPYVMTLWGSNSTPRGTPGNFTWSGGNIGLDLRLGMSVASVPEPGTVGLLGAGLLALLVTRRRRRT